MKYRLLLVIFLTVLLYACTSNKKESNNITEKPAPRTFKPDSLKGKYQLIMTLNKDSLTEENKAFNQGLYGLVMLGSNIEIEFLKENKGLITVEGGMMEVIAAMTGGKVQKFNYSIVDSTLILDIEGNPNKDTIGTITKYNDSYDYLDIKSPSLMQTSLKRID